MGFHNPYSYHEKMIYKLQDKNLLLSDKLDDAKIYIKQLEEKLNQKDSNKC